MSHLTTYVIKRNGTKEEIKLEKVQKRINILCKEFNLDRIDVFTIAKEVINKISNNIETKTLDTFASQIAAGYILNDIQYGRLAGVIAISNHQKNTSGDFVKVTQRLYKNVSGSKDSPLVKKGYYEFVMKHKERILKEIDYKRDYKCTFFSIMTLLRSYLTKVDNTNPDNTDKYDIIERPQDLWMRVAIGLNYHRDNIEDVIDSYNMYSNQYATQASPTLFNAGATKSQLASCFLLNMEDNIEGIFKTVSDCAYISKWSGGIGFSASKIRSSGSVIRGTNGQSSGIVPMLRMLNELTKYINQGGRRNGSIAVYLEPWHADIESFCELKKQDGHNDKRARHLFYGLWVPDLFMKRVKEDKTWSLMCPDQCPGLSETYGEKFEALYQKYEQEKKYVKQIPAKKLWYHILDCQHQTGVPYMMFKDNVNRKSNQMEEGTIQSSNLCTEIVQYTNSKKYAVCNLASLCLPKFIINGVFDFTLLIKMTRLVTRNLNNTIDLSYYPTPETKNSNMESRPLGLGVQGLADVFCILDIPFDSQEARDLNVLIFEYIYFAALTESSAIAKRDGPYKNFKGSPFSKGKLQFHLAGMTIDDLKTKDKLNWKGLINDIVKHGTRNSLLTTVMPTASTSQIMGNNECIEPYTRNIYVRSTLVGEYCIINEHLVKRLMQLNLWTKNVTDQIKYDGGSVQNIREIPKQVKDVYKTAYEIKTKAIMDLAIGRSPFVDQAQSNNLFFDNPNDARLTSSHFYAWKNGLKTAMYYLRSTPSSNPLNFGMEQSDIDKIREDRRNFKEKGAIKRNLNKDTENCEDEICTSCQ